MGVYAEISKPDFELTGTGITPHTLKYTASVTAAACNPVKLELCLDPLLPVFFIDAQNKRTHVLPLTGKTVSVGTETGYEWDVKIEVVETPVVPTACSILIKPTDATGNTMVPFPSYFIYQ